MRLTEIERISASDFDGNDESAYGYINSYTDQTYPIPGTTYYYMLDMKGVKNFLCPN